MHASARSDKYSDRAENPGNAVEKLFSFGKRWQAVGGRRNNPTLSIKVSVSDNAAGTPLPRHPDAEFQQWRNMRRVA